MLEGFLSSNDYFIYYGIHHWGAILFFLVLGFIIIKYGQTLSETVKVRFGTGLGYFLVINSVLYLSIIILKGEFNYLEDLPLNLCVMLPYFMPWFMKSRNKTAYGILYFVILGGTMQGILTPDLRDNGFPSFIYIKFWLEHAGLIILILYATIVYGMRPKWKDYKNAVVFSMLFFLGFLMTVNFILGTNYGFTMEKPIGGSILDLFGPWPIYIVAATCLVFPMFFLLYLPFFIKDIIQKRRKID